MATVSFKGVLRLTSVATTLMGLVGCATTPLHSFGAAEATAAGPSPDNNPRPRITVTSTGPSATKTQCPVEPVPPPTGTAVLEDTSDPHYMNLWQRIRAGFRMPVMGGPLVARYEQWFVDNPQYVERMLQRANLYLYQIVEDVQKRNMPMEIALLPAIESGYSPEAYSRSAAIGLWQFEPATGRLWGLKSNWWYNGERDIIASTNAALDYLQALHKEFHSWDLALAAYNAGEGTVQQAIAHNQALGLGTHYAQLRLPLQTEHYVPKLMAFVNIVRDPQKFGLQLRDIPNSPYFVRVNAGSQIDLSVVARLANMSLKQLYAINPGYRRWATAPHGPQTILVPVATKAALLEGLSQLPPQDRMQWARYIVRPGNTLDDIAAEYGVSVQAIMSTNHLYNTFLRVGQGLLIPVAGRRLVIRREGQPQVAVARNNAGPGLFRVQPGDTLYGIAQQYGVSVASIMSTNHLYNPLLRVGEVLRIPGAESGVRVAIVRHGQGAVFHVQPGDTLYGIAQQYGVSVASIMSVNHLYSPFLQVGQPLRIPGRGAGGVRLALARNGQGRVRIIHRVRPGDTLWSIAQRYRVYVSQLEHWNSHVRGILHLGQRILIWEPPSMVATAEAANRVSE